MALDPQVAVPVSVALALIAIFAQIITYFTKQAREPENGNRKQVENSAKDITHLDEEMHDVSRRLTTLEEQMKNINVEILTLRPKIHELGKDMHHLLFMEEERRRGRKT